jgi:hypothetical protein
MKSLKKIIKYSLIALPIIILFSIIGKFITVGLFCLLLITLASALASLINIE